MTPKAPISKSDVVTILVEIGSILEILGENPFKTRSYLTAARAIDSLSGDLGDMVSSGELLRIRGIGKSIFEKIDTILTKGSLPYYEELKARVPNGLLEMLRISGMGPKKVKAVYEKLGIKTIGELEYACNENRLVELDGFGAKSQEKILAGIQNVKKYMERHLYSFARDEALPVYESLITQPDIHRHLLAGSLRRFKETVKDIDMVVSAARSDRIMDLFASLPQVETVVAKGRTKSSVILHSGINADLRVVSEKEFPYASHHFTGSKEHNTEMRARAKKMGLKMNEYGLFRGDKLISCIDEETIFKKLGLDYIPPELREGAGEIEAAEAHGLPPLIEDGDIRGIFHVHTTYSDGSATIEEMASAARQLGLEYLGVADHSQSASYAGGLKPSEVRIQYREIQSLKGKLEGIAIFHGIESDILPDGSLDYSQEILSKFDFVVSSVHSKFGMSEAEMTKRIIKAIENPFTTILGHPTGRLLLAREGYQVNLHAVIEAAAEYGVVIELNSNPHRLDLDWRFLRIAKEKGVRIVIGPDAHHVKGLEDYLYGVGIARKGWLTRQDVINTIGPEEVLDFLHALRKR